MKEFNVIENGQKGQICAPQQTLKSVVFLQLVGIASYQQPVFIFPMIIGSSNNYETKDQTLRNQAKQILTIWL